MFAYSRTFRSPTTAMAARRFLCNPSNAGNTNTTTTTGAAAFKARRAPVRQKPPHVKNLLLAGFLLASVIGIYTVSIRKMSGQDDIDEILELEHHDHKKQ